MLSNPHSLLLPLLCVCVTAVRLYVCLSAFTGKSRAQIHKMAIVRVTRTDCLLRKPKIVLSSVNIGCNSSVNRRHTWACRGRGVWTTGSEHRPVINRIREDNCIKRFFHCKENSALNHTCPGKQENDSENNLQAGSVSWKRRKYFYNLQNETNQLKKWSAQSVYSQNMLSSSHSETFNLK